MSTDAGSYPNALNASGLRLDGRLERLALFGLASPALLLVLVILILPVGWLFYVSFIGADGGFSLENYERMVTRKSYVRIFITTFKVSLLTTALCIAIGYPLAYFLSQLPTRLANICLVTVLLPFWTSLLVRTYAWLVLLQKRGLVNEWAMSLGLWDEPVKLVHNLNGTLIGMVHIMLPFLVLPVYGAMRSIDRDYLKAAATLGAGPTRAFWGVFFPLVVTGASGRLADGVHPVSRLFRHTGRARWRQDHPGVDEDRLEHRVVRELGGRQRARCGAAGHDHAGAVGGLALRALRSPRQWGPLICSGGNAQRPTRMSRTASACGCMCWPVVTMLLLVTPTLIVIPMSFSDSQYLEFPPETWSLRWYSHYAESAEWMQATRTSFKAALLTMLLCDAARGAGRLWSAYLSGAVRSRRVRAADHADDGAGGADRDRRFLCVCEAQDSVHDDRARDRTFPAGDSTGGDRHGCGTERLRHESRARGPLARCTALEGVSDHHAATDPLRSDHQRIAGVSDLLRRGGDRDVRVGWRQSHPDAQYVQRTARSDRSDHRCDLDDHDHRDHPDDDARAVVRQAALTS